MAIYSDSDYGSIIQIKMTFCADSHTMNTINAYCVHNIEIKETSYLVWRGEGGGGGYDMGYDTKVLPRASGTAVKHAT